jgi:hypothetical protein
MQKTLWPNDAEDGREDGRDLYTRLGDWVGWFCLMGWIGSMVFQSVTTRLQMQVKEVAPAVR